MRTATSGMCREQRTQSISARSHFQPTQCSGMLCLQGECLLQAVRPCARRSPRRFDVEDALANGGCETFHMARSGMSTACLGATTHVPVVRVFGSSIAPLVSQIQPAPPSAALHLVISCAQTLRIVVRWTERLRTTRLDPATSSTVSLLLCEWRHRTLCVGLALSMSNWRFVAISMSGHLVALIVCRAVARGPHSIVLPQPSQNRKACMFSCVGL